MKEAKAVAQTQTQSGARSNTLAILFAAVVGIGIITITGHVQAETLHDAAHDVRHLMGFPCH